MLYPKKTKFKFYHKPSTKGKKNLPILKKGTWALCVLKKSLLTLPQIESIKNLVLKKTKKAGKFYIKTFLHIPCSKKPLSTRMGSGKGSLNTWFTIVKPGDIILEVLNLPDTFSKKILREIAFKLPVHLKIIHSL